MTTLSVKQGFKVGPYRIQMAQNQDDIKKALKLRFEVFNLELNEGIPENASLGIDIDQFDSHCDHLLVWYNDDVVGTYRLLPGSKKPQQGFYSQTEFNLAKTFEYYQSNMSEVVELGRGCISEEHRKQNVLMSLFIGLHCYIEENNFKALFGCASLPPETSPSASLAAFKYLQNNNFFNSSPKAHPLEKNQNLDLESKTEINDDIIKSTIPALLDIYLKIGAKIISSPAYDPTFKCYDLLVFFQLSDLSDWGQVLVDKYKKRILKQQT